MKVQFETYSDRKVTLESSGRDFLLEIENTGGFNYGGKQFAYLTPKTIVDTLNKIPGFKVEYDATRGLPKTEDSIVKRGGYSFVRTNTDDGGAPWVRVPDGVRFTDGQVATGGDFTVVFVAEDKEEF